MTHAGTMVFLRELVAIVSNKYEDYRIIYHSENIRITICPVSMVHGVQC
jgi:superfamily II helicase